MDSSNPDLLDRIRSALAATYDVERLLAIGGMAFVYVARDLKHDRRVALKVLSPELAASVGASRFVREIRFAARLTHPHILPVLDSGDADGLPYYVMPLRRRRIAARPTRSHATRWRSRTPLRLTDEVAGALAYAHAAGIVHRDIKPENILLLSGHALVADFGIARAVTAATDGISMTGVGVTIGTPAYMSPEQAAGDDNVDGRSDTYSLATVFFEMAKAASRRSRLPLAALADDRETVHLAARQRAVARDSTRIGDRC